MVQPGCFEGYGYSALDRSLWLTARNADGTFHVFEDPPVDGFYFAEDFLNSAHPFTPCTPLSITPPLPALPVPTTSDELPPLHIHAPPAAGARYLLVIEAHASADTFLDGQASADQLLAINKVTVRFRSR